MTALGTLETLQEQAGRGDSVRVAVADAAQSVVLETLRAVADLGIVEPRLIGDEAEIASLCKKAGWSPKPGWIVPSGPDAEAAEKAVKMVHAGEADVVMKGNLHTDTFMHALLDAETGLRLPDRRVSHVFVVEVPGHERLLGITDAAINITPDLMAKAQICQNAIDLFHHLGVSEPRVAVLSAVETVTPSIVSTLDAASLTLMARRGQITGARVDGPLAFDNAISPRAVAEKGIVSDVAGRADILLVSDMVSGNLLAKALEYLGGAVAAGVALGLAVPVVLTSRADAMPARMASLEIAALLYRARGRSPSIDKAPELHRSMRIAPQSEEACCPLAQRPVPAAHKHGAAK